MKAILVRDTLTLCFDIGKAMRRAREQGRTPLTPPSRSPTVGALRHGHRAGLGGP